MIEEIQFEYCKGIRRVRQKWPKVSSEGWELCATCTASLSGEVRIRGGTLKCESTCFTLNLWISRDVSDIMDCFFSHCVTLLSTQNLQARELNWVSDINPLNAELNPIRHLLALVWTRHLVHVSRIRVKDDLGSWHEILWPAVNQRPHLYTPSSFVRNTSIKCIHIRCLLNKFIRLTVECILVISLRFEYYTKYVVKNNQFQNLYLFLLFAFIKICSLKSYTFS